MTLIPRTVEAYSAVGATLTKLGAWLVPTLARLVFAGALLFYFWNSASTKIGGDVANLFSPTAGAYAQVFPQKAEALVYNVSKFSTLDYLVVLAGTWAEFLLPLAIVLGLFTRLAALGMIGFVKVQSYVDVTGHKAELGAWFDGFSNSIFDVRSFWVFAFAILVLLGPGPFSIDRLLGGLWRRNNG